MLCFFIIDYFVQHLLYYNKSGPNSFFFPNSNLLTKQDTCLAIWPSDCRMQVKILQNKDKVNENGTQLVSLARSRLCCFFWARLQVQSLLLAHACEAGAVCLESIHFFTLHLLSVSWCYTCLYNIYSFLRSFNTLFGTPHWLLISCSSLVLHYRTHCLTF